MAGTLRKASLKEQDPVVWNALVQETRRQEFGLEMIPSENFASEAVLEACGSVLTNKYAEGLPGARYYGGCEFVDQVEVLAQERAKQLFSTPDAAVEFVNVQPHSGAGANQAIFEAFLKPGDTIMGMRLDHGGHLTHGLKVNFSGKHYKVAAYAVHPETHLIEPDEVMALAKEHRPKMIIAGASAYSRRFDFNLFRKVADEVGALLMADIAHYAGLVATGLYPSPVGLADFITTTTHKTLRGPRSGLIMAKAEYGKEINKAVFPGLQGGPHMHTIAAKAVAFAEAMSDEFKTYSSGVINNARALSYELQNLGFSIISGGTDCHLLVLDLRGSDVTGKEGAELLERVGITANMNTVPFDPQPPRVCSGIRFGTPALTTRGMGVKEMKTIAEFIRTAIDHRDDKSKLSKIGGQVEELSRGFPLYRHRLEGEYAARV